MSQAEDIARGLQRAVDLGEYPRGAMLPSISELARAHGVSEPTARQAYAYLLQWGVVLSQKGRGYFVPPARPEVRRQPQQRYPHEKRRARLLDSGTPPNDVGALEYDAGIPTDSLTLQTTFNRVRLTAELANRFGVVQGTEALHRFYVVGTNMPGVMPAVPVMLSSSFLLMEHVGGYAPLLDPEEEPWVGGTMHQLRCVGIEVARIVDEVRARRPLGTEPDLLQMSPGGVVMELTKVMVATDGRVVEVATSVLPAADTAVIYDVPLDPWPVSHNDEPAATIAGMRRP